MDQWDFKKWRKKLGINQVVAGEMLELSRGAVQYWESDIRPVPRAVELACQELLRRWKQRPEFGPVTLLYADGPVSQEESLPCSDLVLRCEPHPDNESAVSRVARLRETMKLHMAFIVADDGTVIWSGSELLQESDTRETRVQPANRSWEEVGVIQRIFREYVEELHSAEEIARGLNREDVKNHRRRPWTSRMISYILKNENYIGNTVYNRQSFRLGVRRVSNPPSEWIRSKGVISTAVDRSIFLRAQKRRTLRWERLSDGEILQRLKCLLEKKGKLSEGVMNESLGIPSNRVLYTRFGSIRNTYRMIGYQQKWNTDWIDRKQEYKSILADAAASLIGQFETAGRVARFEAGADVLSVENLAISLRLARCWTDKKRKPIWTINRRTRMPNGLILVIRLEEKNREVLDFFLVRTRQMRKGKIRFTEAGLPRFESCRHASLASVGEAILLRAKRRTWPGAPQRRARN